ncbi:four helix bundle protein [Echinicola marina]|uniref:four helix bundle protein n=1 Tax=Echinicola marina TaxID=2859768 RepID=UPI001CF71C29|nr:four helix bundle protein [Echinicola marina]UCS94586.1 four helix bundle protein [Echinicola marina]
MHNYKEFKVWQRSIKLTVEIYRVSRFFPSEEKFGLTSQIRRCAISVPSNISEGAGRKSDREFAQFLAVSHGSICELETQLIVAKELEFIEKNDFDTLSEEINELQKMLYTLILKFEG